MKIYTEEQVKAAILMKHYGLTIDYVLSKLTPIELPSDEEIEEAALKQFPYPIDIKDKNDEIIKTRGVKPFNHAKIEKYRRAFTIGAKYVCSKIQGDRQ
jgi:hypothetical protein